MQTFFKLFFDLGYFLVSLLLFLLSIIINYYYRILINVKKLLKKKVFQMEARGILVTRSGEAFYFPEVFGKKNM